MPFSPAPLVTSDLFLVTGLGGGGVPGGQSPSGGVGISSVFPGTKEPLPAGAIVLRNSPYITVAASGVLEPYSPLPSADDNFMFAPNGRQSSPGRL